MASDFHSFSGQVVIEKEVIVVHAYCMDGYGPKHLTDLVLKYSDGRESRGLTLDGYLSENLDKVEFPDDPIWWRVWGLLLAGDVSMSYKGGWSPDGSFWGPDVKRWDLGD